MIGRWSAALLCVLVLAAPALAAPCGGDFGAFKAAMAREAQAAGVGRATIDSALAGVTPDQAVLEFDRRQRGTFRQSFEQYAATRVLAESVSLAEAMPAILKAICESLRWQWSAMQAIFAVSLKKQSTSANLKSLMNSWRQPMSTTICLRRPPDRRV